MNARPLPRPWLDAGGLALLKLAATGAILANGFRAVSDDDYARVAIAQRFADAPRIDPSGTSWLPLPFYVYGGAFRLLGNSLSVASGTAALCGAVSTLLCWWSARLLGFSRPAALLGAAFGALLPYSLYLGAAPIPEAPCAALLVLAAATLSSFGKLRLLGAAALFAACACRYEAWGVALVFAGVSLWDAFRTRDRAVLGAAAGALAFPALWLLHGLVRHGDATFFVARVSAYRAALGPQDALLDRLTRTPLALLLDEPIVTLAFVGLWLFRAFVSHERASNTGACARFALAVFGVVALSWLGDVRGSAPTHHPGRALLSAWFALALLAGELFVREVRSRPLAIALLPAALGLGIVVQRARWEPFVERHDAVAIGEAARRRGFSALAIDTDDYAFFAIQAAFGHPSRTLVLDDRDPRKPRRAAWTDEPPKLLRTLRSAQIPALAIPRSRVPFAHAVGSVSEENDGFLLLELPREGDAQR